jgi:hypothetical protein
MLRWLLPLTVVACHPVAGDSADTGRRRSDQGAAWVRVRDLEWRRSGPRIACRFGTDEPVEARVCDDQDHCVPAGEGRRHAVQLVTVSSTLRIEVEGRSGEGAVFGPFAVSER